MGVQVPELKQCVTTLVRLFVSSTSSCDVFCLVAWCLIFCFRGILWSSFNLLRRRLSFCASFLVARARIVIGEGKTLTTRRSSFPF
jgi:hypothetical protein